MKWKVTPWAPGGWYGIAARLRGVYFFGQGPKKKTPGGVLGAMAKRLTKYCYLYLSKIIISNIEGRYLLINVLIDYQYVSLNQIKI